MIKTNQELLPQEGTNEFTAQLKPGSRIVTRNKTLMTVNPMYGEDQDNMGELIGFAEQNYEMVWDLRGRAAKNDEWDMIELMEI